MFYRSMAVLFSNPENLFTIRPANNRQMVQDVFFFFLDRKSCIPQPTQNTAKSPTQASTECEEKLRSSPGFTVVLEDECKIKVQLKNTLPGREEVLVLLTVERKKS